MLDDPAAADDLVVETFLRLHRHRDALARRHAAAPLAVHHRPQPGAQPPQGATAVGLAPAVVGERSDDAAARAGGQVRARVAAAFAALPAAQREACSLRLLAELSMEEIARVTSVPVGTVKSRLFHGLRRLRALLADLDPEE